MPRRCPSNAAWWSLQTDRATFLVRREHSLAKALLMQSLAGVAGDVFPARLGLQGLFDARSQVQQPCVIDGDLERKCLRVVADDVDGPDGQVSAGYETI